VQNILVVLESIELNCFINNDICIKHVPQHKLTFFVEIFIIARISLQLFPTIFHSMNFKKNLSTSVDINFLRINYQLSNKSSSFQVIISPTSIYFDQNVLLQLFSNVYIFISL
jgi:hypothetical protein